MKILRVAEDSEGTYITAEDGRVFRFGVGYTESKAWGDIDDDNWEDLTEVMLHPDRDLRILYSRVVNNIDYVEENWI
ncbi:hypothetical protein DRQ25_12130 [Candidatus Fermentibacteria bacterium]|nr:MAG: hypothetical protein DRQ25_12130 [Candidatus Fermentibacteria bacterium]